MKRSDQSWAIYGVLALAAVALVGYVVLLGMGREVPDELLAVVVASAISGALGWARGGTYYDPTAEIVPAPLAEPVAEVQAETVIVEPEVRDEVRAKSYATPPVDTKPAGFSDPLTRTR